ncbi:MAG: hypothetical protein ACJA1Y_000957, partial [Burkholderiaceae bacterium]
MAWCAQVKQKRGGGGVRFKKEKPPSKPERLFLL